MSEKRDCYEILGVPKSANADEVKSAYRKAALKWHPDRNPQTKQEAEEKFREATEAYSILSDPQKRATYDRFGYAGLSRGGFDGGVNQTIFDEFQDIFGDFFGFEDIFGGRRGGRGRAQRGADLRYDMKLTFEEAAVRREHENPHPAPGILRSLQRHGREGGHRGRGLRHVRRSRADPLPAGLLHHFAHLPGLPRRGSNRARSLPRLPRARAASSAAAPSICGFRRASIPTRACAFRAKASPAATTVLPATCTSCWKSSRIRISNAETRTCTAPCRSPSFRRRWVRKLSVPGLNGEETVKIPEGTQTGEIIRLKGKGMPDPHGGGKGDLYVNIHVEIPTKLTREQRRLFEQLGATLPVENRPAHRDSSLFEKVKDIFG